MNKDFENWWESETIPNKLSISKIHAEMCWTAAMKVCNKVEIKHDPLTDPQSGDVVYGLGKMREVISRNGGDIWYVVRNQKIRTKKVCWITTWLDWCKKNKAEVVND